jgi:hypothetical protein
VVVALANTVLGDVDQKHDWLVGAPQSPVALTVSNGANVTSLTLGNGLVSASKLVACRCRCSISLHALIEVTPLAWYVACMYPSACLRSEVVQLRFQPLQAHLRWPDMAMVSHIAHLHWPYTNTSTSGLPRWPDTAMASHVCDRADRTTWVLLSRHSPMHHSSSCTPRHSSSYWSHALLITHWSDAHRSVACFVCLCTSA